MNVKYVNVSVIRRKVLMKTSLKVKMISVILCGIMLIGSTMVVCADTPVCGGNHSYENVRIVSQTGKVLKGSHLHDGYPCRIYTHTETYLQRCACGAERTYTYTIETHEPAPY